MTGTQLQNAVAFWQTMTALGLSLAVESFCLAPGQVCACRAAHLLRWRDLGRVRLWEWREWDRERGRFHRNLVILGEQKVAGRVRPGKRGATVARLVGRDSPSLRVL